MNDPQRDATKAWILSLVGGGEPDLEGVDWLRAQELLALHGLTPLAVATHRAGGAAWLPSAVAEALDPAYRRAALATTLTLETSERARTVLAASGIDSLVFKGAALVRDGVYPDPGARPMDDVDLLVPPGDAKAAVEALESAGFRPWTPWHEGRNRWLDSMSFLDGSSPPGMPQALDLHWRTEYGDLRFGDPEGGSVLWEGADLEVGAPSVEAHLQVVAEHVLKHLRFRVHFPGLADVCRLATRVGDWDAFARLAEARKTAPAVGLVLDVVRADAGAAVPEEVVERLGGRGRWVGRARRWLRLHQLVGRLTPVSGRSAGLALRWTLAGSAGDALRDLTQAAFPDREWLRARYGAGRSTASLWLRYAWDSARWLVHRGASPASPNQEL